MSIYFIPFEVFFIFWSFVFCFFFSTLLFGISCLVDSGYKNIDKSSPYECGFSPFDDARNFFFVKFYLVGLLFIIFDLEVLFLYPWSINLQNIIDTDFIGVWSMFFFLVCLIVGFVYEWLTGALDWE